MPAVASAMTKRAARGLGADWPGAGSSEPGSTKGRDGTRMSPASVRCCCRTSTGCGSLRKLGVCRRSRSHARAAVAGRVAQVCTTPGGAGAKSVGKPATVTVAAPAGSEVSTSRRCPETGSIGTVDGSTATQQASPLCGTKTKRTVVTEAGSCGSKPPLLARVPCAETARALEPPAAGCCQRARKLNPPPPPRSDEPPPPPQPDTASRKDATASLHGFARVLDVNILVQSICLSPDRFRMASLPCYSTTKPWGIERLDTPPVEWSWLASRSSTVIT